MSASAAIAAHSSPAETRAERRVRRLERMGDIGLDIAEKLRRQAELAAVHSEVEAVPDNIPHSKRLDEIGRAFAQVSRAVSLSTALEDRLDRGLEAIPGYDREMRERSAGEKRAELARAVVHAIETDPAVGSRRRMIDLRIRLDRLLDAELRDLDVFLRRPFEEVEARLRRDLGLEAEAEADPSPLAGEGSPAMPEPGESRAEAHGGGCGVDRRRPMIPTGIRSRPPRRSLAEPPFGAPGASMIAFGGREAAAPGLDPGAVIDPPDTPKNNAFKRSTDRCDHGEGRGVTHPEPASKIARMGSRTARGRGPPGFK